MARIFLDSSDISDINQLLNVIESYDGQTTNPSNFVQSLIKNNDNQHFSSSDELLIAYKKRVQEISEKLPKGSVSIEVYADKNITANEMIQQAVEMNSWIKNAHIKLPIIPQGLETAKALVEMGIKVNMTLCFSQEQAAAVYAATLGAKKGDVFISPFVGRLNDTGKNGIDLIKNIVKMYSDGDGHVEVLGASIRDADQLTDAIAAKADIVTSYLQAIVDWVNMGKPIDRESEVSSLHQIDYSEISINKKWDQYDIHHDLTDIGLIKFASDWNSLIK